MKKFSFQIIALLIVVSGALYFVKNTNFFSSTPATPTQPSVQVKKIQIIDTSSSGEVKPVKAALNVEIAETREKRSKGLGGRELLASDSGMLFIFDKSDKYQFWMKGLKFPLDFIWINDDRVVDILTDIPPPQSDQKDDTLPQYAPVVIINKVLEVNAGFVSTHSIRVGDKIEFLE